MSNRKIRSSFVALNGFLVVLSLMLFWLLLPAREPVVPALPAVPAVVQPSPGEAEKAVPWTREASPIGDLLLGHKPEDHRSSAGGHRPASPITAKSSAGSGVLTRPDRPGPHSTHPGVARHPEIGSRVPRRIDERDKDATQTGPGEREVARVVAQSQPAFRFCIEQELRKNPAFRGGKFFVTATVGSSGIVKSVRIGRRDLEFSPLGSCLKAKTMRMVFPAFSGSDAEVQVPLILTANLP